MSDKRLKTLEEEVAYLRKSIDELIEQKPIEIHNHYYYEYDGIKKSLNKYFDQNDTY